MDEDHNTPIRIVKKNKRAHTGSHGGAWKVAYADFVTAMMALFIVLWIVGQSEAVKQAVSAYFKDPGAFSTSKTGGLLPDNNSVGSTPKPLALDNLAAEMDKLKSQAGEIQKAIAEIPDFAKFKDKIQVSLTPEGLRIDLVEASEGLFFDIGKATVKPETVKLLKVIASHLGELSNGVVIEGYTDARPYASSGGYTNWNLSADRANSARMVLEAGGLRDHQVLEVRGFADRKLKVPDKPLDYSNRRVSILVTPSTNPDPKAASNTSTTTGPEAVAKAPGVANTAQTAPAPGQKPEIKR